MVQLVSNNAKVVLSIQDHASSTSKLRNYQTINIILKFSEKYIQDIATYYHERLLKLKIPKSTLVIYLLWNVWFQLLWNQLTPLGQHTQLKGRPQYPRCRLYRWRPRRPTMCTLPVPLVRVRLQRTTPPPHTSLPPLPLRRHTPVSTVMFFCYYFFSLLIDNGAYCRNWQGPCFPCTNNQTCAEDHLQITATNWKSIYKCHCFVLSSHYQWILTWQQPFPGVVCSCRFELFWENVIRKKQRQI